MHPGCPSTTRLPICSNDSSQISVVSPLSEFLLSDQTLARLRSKALANVMLSTTGTTEWFCARQLAEACPSDPALSGKAVFASTACREKREHLTTRSESSRGKDHKTRSCVSRSGEDVGCCRARWRDVSSAGCMRRPNSDCFDCCCLGCLLSLSVWLIDVLFSGSYSFAPLFFAFWISLKLCIRSAKISPIIHTVHNVDSHDNDTCNINTILLLSTVTKMFSSIDALGASSRGCIAACISCSRSPAIDQDCYLNILLLPSSRVPSPQVASPPLAKLRSLIPPFQSSEASVTACIASRHLQKETG